MSKKSVELPILEPMYSTLHNQGQGTATIAENPSIRNWYLNHAMIFTCKKWFLNGFTTPRLEILQSSMGENPYFIREWCPMKYTKGYLNYIIRAFLDDGYYVGFGGIDDYYVEGKSWYQKRHFYHDGMICGYDQEEKTYTLYAYDQNWVCRTFKVSQESFNKGRVEAFKKGVYGHICGIKPKTHHILELEPQVVLEKLREYLDSSLEKYPPDEEGDVFGIAVQDYIAMYLDCLYKGSIPHERMDRRVFRFIWEHKKVMLERLQKMEEALNLDSEISCAYEKIVSEANALRMLYASHMMKRRDSILPGMSARLIKIRQEEEQLLHAFLKKAEGVVKDDAME